MLVLESDSSLDVQLLCLFNVILSILDQNPHKFNFEFIFKVLHTIRFVIYESGQFYGLSRFWTGLDAVTCLINIPTY